VKRIVAVFLLMQILSANSFAMEIMRLPFLVQHYLEHEKQGQADSGFVAFLSGHYLEEDHADKGHCHEKLPFKHCHDCCSHHLAQATYLVPESDLAIVCPDPSSPVCMSSEENFCSLYSGTIWQPPKINS
jgi:hypothetical protein